MINQTQAAALLLEHFRNPTKMFLHGWQRESFFDPDVQKVLLERHPHRGNYPDPLDVNYPIRAWQVCDQQCLGTQPFDQTELDARTISNNDREWFARLALAVIQARKRIVQRERNPQTILEKFIAWRNDYFLHEKSTINPAPPATKYADALASIFGKQKLSSGGKKSNEGTDRALSAIRKGIHSENKRRGVIMQTWSKCWLVHLTGRCLPEAPAVKTKAVTKTPPNK